jgi:trehalose/maltose hydrolase-like predicted phosphorylase
VIIVFFNTSIINFI